MTSGKTGLVLEGGAMRGLFSAGVMDIFMENGIFFDGIAAVSAGACFGCSYKSHQIGRSIRYSKRYCNDKRYASWQSWLKTGNLYNAEFDYITLPDKLDVFDAETFRKSPMEFYVVCTNVDTGEPVYKKLSEGGRVDLQWIRASASMPVFSRPVRLDGKRLWDGGIADAIPVRWFQSIGYDRLAVILTQPDSYVKERSSLRFAEHMFLRKYPAVVAGLDDRHIRYNETVSYIRGEAEKEDFLVIQPESALQIGTMEKNADEMERVYQIGRNAGTERLSDVRTFLEKRNM